jgi:hypothetical protein
MSVVTSGPNNFASEWANGINYGLIVRKSSDGEITHYKPSADADVARGTALATAVNALQSGDSLIISGGSVYDMDSNLFTVSGKSDIGIVGVGRPIIKRRLTTISEGGISVDASCSNININGITLHTQILDADYVSGPEYSLVHNASGLVESCNIYLYSTVVTIEAGQSFKTLVHIEEVPLSFRNCNVFSLNSVSGMADQFYIGAFHAGVVGTGANALDISGCSFLSQNINAEPFLTNPRGLSGCASNTGAVGNSRYLNLPEAKGLFDAEFISLLDASFYSSQWRGDAAGVYTFTFDVDSSGGASGSVPLFNINLQPNVTSKAYTLEIHDDGGCFWKAYNRHSNSSVIYGDLTSGFTDYDITMGVNQDIFSTLRDGTTNRRGVTVIFRPDEARATDGKDRISCLLEPFDVNE